jgi:hypothetical protein
MQIPKSVKIGKRKWHINTVPLQGLSRGHCYPAAALIEMASDDTYVFWHELTHAILHDMGANYKDEQFVIDFSKRLDQAIKTARF